MKNKERVVFLARLAFAFPYVSLKRYGNGRLFTDRRTYRTKHLSAEDCGLVSLGNRSCRMDRCCQSKVFRAERHCTAFLQDCPPDIDDSHPTADKGRSAEEFRRVASSAASSRRADLRPDCHHTVRTLSMRKSLLLQD